MYAIVETCGRQYKVTEGDVLFVEKLPYDEGSEVVFDKILAVSGEKGLVAGAPVVDGASVKAKVLSHGKDSKIIVFKFKAKKGYRRKRGHRQPHTKIQIESINM